MSATGTSAPSLTSEYPASGVPTKSPSPTFTVRPAVTATSWLSTVLTSAGSQTALSPPPFNSIQEWLYGNCSGWSKPRLP